MYHNIHVVYTKEAETADQYIEKTVHRIGHNGNVTVASSDGLEQIIIMGAGAHRLSARDLRTEIEHTNGQDPGKLSGERTENEVVSAGERLWRTGRHFKRAGRRAKKRE